MITTVAPSLAPKPSLAGNVARHEKAHSEFFFDSYSDFTTSSEPTTKQMPTESYVASTNCTSDFCCNQQYSVTAITTAAGAIAERYAYTAYGLPTILNASATIIASSAISNRYTYTGREWDATLSLHHFRARWMSPIAGRFLGRDPGRYVDGLSLYRAYFAASLVDPFGREIPVALLIPEAPPPVAPPVVGGVCRLVATRVCAPVAVAVTSYQCGTFLSTYTTVPLCVKTYEWVCSEEEYPQPNPDPEPRPPRKPPRKPNACDKAGWTECPSDLLDTNRVTACNACFPGYGRLEPGRAEDPDYPSYRLMDPPRQIHYSCKQRGGKGRGPGSIICGFCCVDIGGVPTMKEGCLCSGAW
jgi:RHS repeat-associated protein